MDRWELKPFLEKGEAGGGGSGAWHGMRATIRKVGAEVLGTFLLIFAACGSIAGGLELEAQASAVAFCLVGLISSLAHVSGAHFNPAISLAFAATRQFSWSQVPWYIGGQLLGGTMAVWVVKGLYYYETGEEGMSLLLTVPSHHAWLPSLMMETVLTFSLSFFATAMNTLPNIGSFRSINEPNKVTGPSHCSKQL